MRSSRHNQMNCASTRLQNKNAPASRRRTDRTAHDRAETPIRKRAFEEIENSVFNQFHSGRKLGIEPKNHDCERKISALNFIHQCSQSRPLKINRHQHAA